ncbi:MAG: PAS domain S-box protein [Deltaproteobacteria bacterium]|nr:PAS domain S-box protein [Deltaproteobacteria bacterium]
MARNPRQSSMRQDLHEAAQHLEEFRQIIENASDAVVTINEHHEVIYLNRAAEEMFGYAREEVLGGDLAPLVPQEHRALHRGYLDRYLATRRARLIGHLAEVQGERRDGARFPMHIALSVAEVGGAPLFTAIMRDLSPEREMAEKVRNTQQLALLGQTVATVSHEIRHPLALIGGFAHQLERENGLSSRGRRKVGIIVEEVARLEQLLNELNDLSRPARYSWRLLDVNEVADRVLELLEPALWAQAQLTVQREADLPPVMADRDRLGQVLLNLLANAVQAGGDDPRVELVLGRGAEGGVEIQVRDHGQGITPEHLAEVFTPFFTTKPRGTGLGLPLARRIVEEHGGALALESTPGQGTRATVNLPPARGGLPPASPPLAN